MKKRLLASLLGAVMLLSVGMTGCGQKATENTGTAQQTAEQTAATPKILRLNNQSEPGSLHPGKAQGTHDSWLIEHVMEGLTKKSPEGKVVEGMATAWTVSEDGTVYTFTLRDGVKWSNGDPMVAKDFEIAWKYLLNPKTASEYAYQCYYLANGEAFNASTETDDAKLKELEDAVGVKALDEKTLEVRLEAPTPYFLELLSFYTYYPVNHKVQEANPDWANDASTYVSNGPFIFTEWKHKESMKIVKNEEYYDKDKVKLNEIHFAMIEDENTAWQMYRNDELDMAYPLPQDVTAQLSAQKDPEFVIGAELATYFYRFNTTKKPFNNVNVRRALSMTIDRKTIVESVAQGGQTPAYTLTPYGIADVSGDFTQNTGELFKYDPTEAQKLLAQGLQEEGMDKMPNFVILYNTSEGHKKIAEAIQEMWRKDLGIQVTLENVEFQIKLDREDKLDFEVARSGWVGDYVDPMTFLDMFESTSQQNDTGWVNAEYDALIRAAKANLDLASRSQQLHDAEKILMSEMPIAPIYFYTAPYTLKPYVKDSYKPINRYTQFQYADIVK